MKLLEQVRLQQLHNLLLLLRLLLICVLFTVASQSFLLRGLP